MRSKIRVAITAGVILLVAVATRPTAETPSFSSSPETIDVEPGAYAYRMAGDFALAGRPISAPLVALTRRTVLRIMKRQVTSAEFDLCVDDGRCAPRSPETGGVPDLPAVGVSWRDATDYAAWLSLRTGHKWRLPTDEEWAFAAGSRFRDDGLSVAASGEPSARWLARYERESETAALDQRPLPVGAFGANEHGLLDLAGNVWEWTDTCFTRQSLDQKGAPVGALSANCGVRVAEGQHRAYVVDFIRDARGGGCSAGEPPANLGFRLVWEDGAASVIASAW